MNKKDIEKRNSNRLFIIGSSRGVNRFYITNRFIEKFPEAKVINTGVLINSLSRNFNLGSSGDVNINDYYRYLEPVFIQSILNHLEHGDVILDTHFYHMIPCISMRGLNKFIGKISKAIIVLVEEDSKKIYLENKGKGDKWFDSLEDIKYDVSSNEEYYHFYKRFFSKYISEVNIIISVEKDYVKDLEKFLEDLK